MTEDEATSRRCCGPEGTGNIRTSFSKVGDVETTRALDRLCLGSKCMAWRWVPLKADDAFAAAVKQAAEDIGDKTESRARAAKYVIANRAKYGLPTEPFDGYCGLAGEPRA